MALLGPLDPRQQQQEQRAALTAQSQHYEDELTKMLREGGQRQQQAFTSPWQAAGQMAQALSGRMHANQNAQNYAALNAGLAPGGGPGEAPPAQAPQAAAAPDGAPAAPAAAHGVKPFDPIVKQAIIEGSQLAGVDPNMMATFAHIESNGDPNAHKRGSQYKGLMQLNEQEMAEHSGGQGNVWNPRDSVRAAGMIVKRNQEAYEKFTGRQASPFDLYMMHQQGPAGYLQHIGNPNASAIGNMASTQEGRAKGPGWAHDAIVENGGRPGDTSAQFIGRWRAKFDRLASGDVGAFQTAQATPGGGGAPEGGTPVPAGAAPPGAPTAAAGAPGQSPGLIERGQFYGRGGYAIPQPTYSQQKLDQLARSGMLSPEQIDKFKAEITASQQPVTREGAGGRYTLNPGSGEETYTPTIQTKDIDVNGVKVPQQFYIDSKGQPHVIGRSSAPGGAPRAPAAAPAPGADDPFPESGDVTDIAAWAERRATRMAGEKTSAEENAKVEPDIKKAIGIEAGKAPIDTKKEIDIAKGKVGPEIELEAGKTRVQGQEKDWNAAHTGFTGMGLNFAQQAPNLKTLTKLAPLAYTGTGADTMLALNRFADKIGLSERKAAPRELFEQLATKILGDQFAGIRNASLEEGNPAARIFKAMLEVEEKSNISAHDSLTGVMAKLKRMQNVADKGMHWADLADEYVAKNKHLDPRFMTALRKEIANTDYDEGVEFEGSPAPAAEQTKEIGGKTYYKRNGKWYTE